VPESSSYRVKARLQAVDNSHYQPLPGGDFLPWWIAYDYQNKKLQSRGEVPETIINSGKRLIIHVEDEAGVITKLYEIQVQSDEKKNTRGSISDSTEKEEDKNEKK